MLRTIYLFIIGLFCAAGLPSISHAAPGDQLLHNSANTSTNYGTWGVSGGKYGQFTCNTCHTPRATNIKGVKSVITAPQGVWSSSKTATVNVVFNRITSTDPNAGSMGHDLRTPLTSSANICEVCHSKTTHHRYDASPLPLGDAGAGTGRSHNNGRDCMACHPHNSGFKSAGCNGCHGYPITTDTASSTGLAFNPNVTNATGVGTPKAAGHPQHNTIGYSCDVCHSGNTMPTVSNTIQMGFSYGNVTTGTFKGSNTIGNGFSYASSKSGTTVSAPTDATNTCNNLYCHSDGGNYAGARTARLTNWTAHISTAPQSQRCSRCHGTQGGAYVTTDRHPKHVTTYPFACVECHASTVDASNNITGNHVNSAKNVAWKSGGMNSDGTAYARPNCANIYCHSKGVATATPYTAPLTAAVWNSVDATAYSECRACHGGDSASASAIDTGGHTPHVNNTGTLGTGNNFGCAECHAKTVNANRTVSTLANHVNKFKEYSGVKAGTNASCASFYCHSNGNPGALVYENPPGGWTGGALGCNGCHGKDAAPQFPTSATGAPNYASAGSGTATANSHKKHVYDSGITDTKGCVTCHARTVDGSTAGKLRNYSTLHLNGAPNIAFKSLDGKTGTFDGSTCSNTYCHGTAATLGWGATTGVPLACDSCHAANANAGKHWGANSAHKLHVESTTVLPGAYVNYSGNVSSAAEYRFSCSSCHSAAKGATHATGPKVASVAAGEVFFGYTSPGRQGSYTYGGSAIANDNGFNWSNGGAGCETSYCHSNGQGGNALSTVSWNTTVRSTGATRCTKCHANARGTATPMSSGKHRAHMNNYTTLGATNFGCVSCHARTVSNNTTIVNRAYHINKLKNYSGLYAQKNYNASTKVCSNVYCHSNGKGIFVAMTSSKAWGGTATFGCNGCHGRTNSIGYPDNSTPNSHSTHATKMGLNDTKGCFKCHRDTVDGANVNRLHVYSTNHLDGNASADIRFNPIDGKTGTYNGSNCSNTYCHGTAASPNWGSTISCGQYCHSANTGTKTNNTNTLQGSHYKHYSTSGALPAYTNPAGNVGSGGRYKWECKSCHNEVHANGPAHSKGYAKVLFDYTTAGKAGTYTPGSANNTDSRGYKWSDGTCGNTYCHSNGNGTSVNVQWSATLPANCTGCHGGARGTATPMATGKHRAHMNNYTTLGSSMFGCKSCHAGTVSNNTTISSPRHVNKFKNFSGLYAGDNYDYATKTCTNFYCHSDSKGRFINPGSWFTGTPPKGCDGCHGRSANGSVSTTGGLGYPNYTSSGAGTLRANSHKKHIEVNAITDTRGCSKCHWRTVDRTNVSRQHPYSSNHLDGNTSYDVTPDSSAGITYTYTVATKTCNNISCHGGTGANAQWGQTVALKCKSCHYGASQVNNYLRDGVQAKVNSTAWRYSGHGKESGTYDITGSAFAGFSSAAKGGDMCYYCHDPNVQHQTAAYTTLGTNPMRLRNYTSATYGKNKVCLKCHATGSTGVDPDGAATVYTLKNGAKKINKRHQGAKHTSTNDGGQLCWDCHNPHGESTSTSGPIAMIRANPWMKSYSSSGIRQTATGTAVVFSNRTAAGGVSNWVKTTSPYSGICQVCHTATNYWRSDGTLQAHNSGRDCSACHLHSKDTTYDGNAYEGAGNCVDCHAATQSDAANTDIDNNGTRTIVAEFSRASHHVTGVTVTNQHCTMCHMEGNAADAKPGASHKNGQIDLRNVDTNTAIVWTGTEHTNMDNFCFGCHDSDGVSNATVRAIVTGATATNPFNDTLTNGYDQVARAGVLNVKSQFATSNASHHAVSGQKYTTGGTQYMFNASKFVSTFTPLGGAATIRDSSTIHCGDCHTNGQWATVGGIGAHGSTNEYMLQNSAGTDVEHTKTTYVCYKCHVGATYNSNAHYTGGNGGDYVDTSTGVGIAGRVTSKGNITGMACANCHNVGATGWGGIHGATGQYQDGGGSWQTTYRFMPGMSNSKYQPGTWSAAAFTSCYTGPTADWGNCNSHSSGGKSGNRGVTRPLSY